MIERVENLLWSASESAGRGDDVLRVVAGPDQVDRDVSQGRHDAWPGIGADLGPVLIKGDIADVEDVVLDGSVTQGRAWTSKTSISAAGGSP